MTQRLAPTPCHHGCGCQLHDLVVYGALAGERRPDSLDDGELQALFVAARRASDVIMGQRQQIEALRHRVMSASGSARAAVQALVTFAESERLARSHEDHEALRARFQGFDPDLRRAHPLPVRIAARSVLVAIAIFDAWYFATMFQDLLRVPVDASWWERYLGFLPGAVLPVGLVLAGVVVAGPIWRLVQRWRRSAPPAGVRGWLVRGGRVAAVLAFPTFLFYVVGVWAGIRAEGSRVPLGAPAVLPQVWTVVLLLLALATVAVVIEVWLGNPVVADLRAAERNVRVVEHRRARLEARAGKHVLRLEHRWSDLRAGRDEVLALVRVEVGKVWETLILPARMRHGVTGNEPPEILVSGNDRDEARLAVEFFRGIRQPMPGLGPLNELIRLVDDLDPRHLHHRWAEVNARLDGQMRGIPAAAQSGGRA